MYLITQLAQHLPPHMHMRWSLQKLCRVDKQQWRPVKFSLSRSMYWWAQGGFKVSIVRLLTCLYFLQTFISVLFWVATRLAFPTWDWKWKRKLPSQFTQTMKHAKAHGETLEMIKKRHLKANWIYCATNQVKRGCKYAEWVNKESSETARLRKRRRVHTHTPTRPVASEWVMQYLSV